MTSFSACSVQIISLITGIDLGASYFKLLLFKIDLQFSFYCLF